MQVFLKIVAQQIYDEYGTDLSKHKLVFPNRRSSLYFRKYLSDIVDKAVLSPEIKTINELFKEWSSCEVADPLFLMFSLYESYSKLKNPVEPFDEFYYWGEMLVNDFDDIDKYLVDHSVIFQNLRDIRDIESKFGGLEPEVIDIIRQFWTSFDPAKLTPEKDDFLAVWDLLTPLYQDFRQRLRKAGLAYEGMIMRDVIELLSQDKSVLSDSPYSYHFIGFNALNRCEKELLGLLKKSGKAYFYWDYDKLYVNENQHEAGFFLRDNLAMFGQDIKGSLRFDRLISEDQPTGKFKVFKAPSDVAQAKLIPSILREFGDAGVEPDKTAIILADENMLMPLINSLPPELSDINVTMGYPLYQTPVYSLVHQLLSLRRNARRDSDGNYSFYHVDVLKILSHQYISFSNSGDCDTLKLDIRENNLIRVKDKELQVNGFFTRLFQVADTHRGYNTYLVDILSRIMTDFSDASQEGENGHGEYFLQQEYLYRVITSLNRLASILEEAEVPVGLEVYIRIVDKILHKLSVPFSGEPLSGLQVMGILESRALDFENIVFVSVNEGVLPRGSAGSSYIPYNLRMAFGLPTVKHQDSIFAYYFYRLLQRAGRIRFIYNSSASGLRTGEMSRFLLQLKYKEGFNTVFSDSRFNIIPPPVRGTSIRREDKAQKILEDMYLSEDNRRRALSPSALNTWINCRIKFYYRYVLGLQEPDNVKEEVDSPMFGTILHDAMNKLYSGFVGSELCKNEIDRLIADKKEISRVVEESFRKNYLRGGRGEISGRNLIITSVIRNMIEKILEIDRKTAPLRIVELEKKHYSEMAVEISGVSYNVLLGGIIDRVDDPGLSLRILDYKSGKDDLDIESLESLTSYKSRNRNSAAFQTLVYSLIYADKKPSLVLRPSLYPVRAIYSDSFSDIFKIKKGEYKGDLTDFSLVKDEFRENLHKVLTDLFDPGRDFDMTENDIYCKYCPFSGLCGRYDLT